MTTSPEKVNELIVILFRMFTCGPEEPCIRWRSRFRHVNLFWGRMTSGFSCMPPSNIPSGADVRLFPHAVDRCPTGWLQRQSTVTLNFFQWTPLPLVPAMWSLVRILWPLVSCYSSSRNKFSLCWYLDPSLCSLMALLLVTQWSLFCEILSAWTYDHIVV